MITQRLHGRIRTCTCTWTAPPQHPTTLITPITSSPLRAGMYVWLRLPAGVDDVAFCQRLVADTGIALSPGRGFGPGGAGFVRVALVQPEGVLAAAAEKIAAAMRAAKAALA